MTGCVLMRTCATRMVVGTRRGGIKFVTPTGAEIEGVDEMFNDSETPDVSKTATGQDTNFRALALPATHWHVHDVIGNPSGRARHVVLCRRRARQHVNARNVFRCVFIRLN